MSGNQKRKRKQMHIDWYVAATRQLLFVLVKLDIKMLDRRWQLKYNTPHKYGISSLTIREYAIRWYSRK